MDMASFDNIDVRNLGNGSGTELRIGNTRVVIVKLPENSKSSFDVSGAVKLTGITGNVAKDKQTANNYLAFVEDEEGKVRSLGGWDLNNLVNDIAKATDAPAEVIFKLLHLSGQKDVDPTQGSL